MANAEIDIATPTIEIWNANKTCWRLIASKDSYLHILNADLITAQLNNKQLYYHLKIHD